MGGLWGRLTGTQPDARISTTYPAPGQRRIPATGWDRATFAPGSHMDRGGARTRIAASVSAPLPYRAPGGPGIPSDALPVGSMTITERDTAEVVPLKSGYPRVVPYGPDAGTHTIDVQPAGNLDPCTWYRVDTTSLLLDARGEAVTPFSWEFRTGLDGEGRRCADDPYTADENWIRAAYQDVLGRAADVGGLESWTYARARGLSNGRFATSLVGGAESRSRIAATLYTDLLGRDPEPAGRAFWANQLTTITLPTVRSRILATPEVYAQAGGIPDGYVTHLYQLVLGRAPSPDDLGYWTGRLESGMTRGALAKFVLASTESYRRIVRGVYSDLLGRSAGLPEVDYWVAQVKRSDERLMVRFVIGSTEYYNRSQLD